MSRVLNNSGPVSEEVRDRVEKAVLQHGYVHQASRRAGGSRNGRCESAVILLFRPGPIETLAQDHEGVKVLTPKSVEECGAIQSLHQLSNGFFHLVFDGILEEANRREIRTSLLACSELDTVAVTDRLKNDHASCVLFVGPYRPELEPLVRDFQAPIVFAGLNYVSRHDSITIDNWGGIRQVVEHLVEQGHRDIGFVGVHNMPDFHERRLAFLAHMHDAGLPIRNEWISLGTLQMSEITQRVAKLLGQSHRPTALVCGNDLTAIATIEAARQQGLSVPQQLSVTGFDDIPVASVTSPALTTVHVPMHQIGRQSVRQMVLRHASPSDPEPFGCVTRVTTQLIPRSSTAQQ